VAVGDAAEDEVLANGRADVAFAAALGQPGQGAHHPDEMMT